MDSRWSDLSRALWRLTCAERAGALAATLGLEPVEERQAERFEAGAVGASEVGGAGDRVRLVAERGGMRMLLLEHDGEVSLRRVSGVARRVRAADPTHQHVIVFVDRSYRRVGLAAFGLEGELRDVVFERERPRPSDLDLLAEMIAAEGEGGIALAVRYARALDRSRVTGRFFTDLRAQRARIAAAWQGLPADLLREREQLALLLLCRLMFLYFLQRQGLLCEDPAYLPNLLRRWRRRASRAGPTFYRGRLVPLFFGALNTRPHERGEEAKRLGALPYLNGGLFEWTGLERRHSDLDLSDAVVVALFDELLERYRFTARDASDDVVHGAFAAAIDPEMLGRAFEALMDRHQRGSTGTFFTPAATVDRLVVDSLTEVLCGRTGIDRTRLSVLLTASHPDALSSLDRAERGRLARALPALRVLDPACGSGAFLVGVLSRLAPLRSALESAGESVIRRDVVGRCLYGVDVQSDAALLCALRLWLALTLPAADGVIEPLPNLDRRIRQGDALLDPLDLAMPGIHATPIDRAAAVDPAVRRAMRALDPAARRYVGADPHEREALQHALMEGETALAGAWVDAIERRLGEETRSLRAAAGERDLWGESTTTARAASASLARLEGRARELGRLRTELERSGSTPFFSFGVHFPDASVNGFDVIVSNPPWVRAHRWPAALLRAARSRYAVARESGWRAGARLAGAPVAAAAQLDLAMLFVERALALLAPGGTLGMLLPAKFMRSLYGGSARRLLAHGAPVSAIDDHSLNQKSVFRADAFTAAIVATRAAPAADAEPATAVRVRLLRRKGEPWAFDVPRSELGLFPADLEAPWLLVPDSVRRALRRMQSAGRPIGATDGLRVRRGVFTGANEVLVVREAVPRLSDLATIRAEGWFRGAVRSDTRKPVRSRPSFEAVIEASALRPILRGRSIGAWRYEPDRWVVWAHDESGRAGPLPSRAAAYVLRHRERLERRTGVRAADPPGALFRVTPAALGHKVVWRDIARTLEAVAVPATMRNALGLRTPVIPLNTVYFISTPGRGEAVLLTAYLNSLPARAFARAIAERAKDARFRFFAWTIAALPLPTSWRTGGPARELQGIAERAHTGGALAAADQATLDRTVAKVYGLRDQELIALQEFDAWMSEA